MKGIAASPGIAIGKALVKREKDIKISKDKISEDKINDEIEKLHTALKKAKSELKTIRDNTAEKMGEEKAEIFDAHLMILDDPELIPAFENKIKEDKLSSSAAVKEVIDQYASMFAAMEDEYLKERGTDIKDVGKRIIKILLGREDIAEKLDEEVIIIAEDLTPSDTAQLDTSKVLAFLTRDGSRTSHTAIMARSLGIPAVVGLGDKLMNKNVDDAVLIVDGNSGNVYFDPDEATMKKYEQKLADYEAEQERLAAYKDKKAKTKDGEEVEIAGNMGNFADLDPVLERGGEGIGLFRTEFLYMDRDEMPSEEEQFEVYRKVAEKMGDYPVVIRTLDIGGDKELPYLDLPHEMNPFLGYRAVRMCLDRPDIFKPQLRAILRASKYGNLKMMFPMISSLEELNKVKNMLNEVKSELNNEKIEYNKDIEVGIMIEIPAAVMIADLLAKEVDFFSIGTNDLIQYTVAVDRTNEKIAEMHTPYHPAVLRLIKKTIDEGHKAGIWVGMCGEAAGDELLLPFLLGAGLDEFSMSAVSILKIKELLEKWTRKEAEKEMESILKLKTAAEVKEYLEKIN
ncbi:MULTISPECIES: phosphoenolpyruvate--protein phosphotransferase [unclassified Halanaerobium]|uniref:phosphoenolpyruvate--protein phosphotransferase n=1 Tax=unclassified Halanaerobium TaxID=2641197 RepID=UPI000DF2F0B3|nr:MULTISPECIES: phosphoenolpyruvate--protein phosphotransferase [unclassified Halanaerobium]RCW51366.1 phosphoenolpyruvate--protein phosphotransferase [Halanaerobium sp. MA284_MarDTE_T2]RCW81435.1 phosphoenolpyruvate--protein phosphotransferase [Halanaerobium sp. DL-01]